MSMPVSTLTGADLVCVLPDASLSSVAGTLADGDIGAVVVGDPANVMGIVSERDIVRVVAARGDLDVITAGEAASKELVWCSEDSTVADVAAEMLETYVRHVLVNSSDGLVGLVSSRDLLGVYATDDMVD